MNKEDYNKYYIQGSDHYLIPKYVFIELFNEMVNWREKSQKQKEVINKLIEYLQEKYDSSGLCGIVLNFTEFEDIKDLLKEVEQMKTKGILYQEYEPTPENPCEIQTKNIFGKNLLEGTYFDGNGIPKMIGITKDEYLEYKKLKNKLSKIETLIINHNCDTGDIYYKYNSKFLKSELKQRILEIIYEEDVSE